MRVSFGAELPLPLAGGPCPPSPAAPRGRGAPGTWWRSLTPDTRDALSFHANRPWVLLSGEAVHSVRLSGKRGCFLTLRLEHASWTLRTTCSASRPPAQWAAPLGEQAWGRALFQGPDLPSGPRLWGSGAPGAVHLSLHSSVWAASRAGDMPGGGGSPAGPCPAPASRLLSEGRLGPRDPVGGTPPPSIKAPAVRTHGSPGGGSR